MAAAVTYSKSSSFMAELKALYVSPPVQRIRFRFGPAQILPADYRYLALKLGAKESWVSIDVDPTQTAGQMEGLLAELMKPADEAVVAHRFGHRWIQTFEPLSIESPADADRSR